VFDRVVDGVFVALTVLTDADIDERFPSAHLLQIFITYPHVPPSCYKQPVDVVVDLLLEVQVRGVADFEVSVGQ
jgi:hypothetical protein